MKIGKCLPLVCLLLLPALFPVAAVPNQDPWGIVRKANDLFKKNDYAGLEALMAGLKKNGYDIRQAWPEGSSYYSGFGGPDTQEGWEGRRKQIEDWIAAYPDSITAKEVLANWYIGYAWKARGGGWASSVTEDGWQLMKERLAKAEEIMEQVDSKKVDDPAYWYVRMDIAFGQGKPEAATGDYYRNGVKLAKEFYQIYRLKAYYLLPRWYGKPGESEAYIRKAADTFPPEKGDVLYAYLAHEEHPYYGNDFFEKTGFDYERIKRGYFSEIARMAESRWGNRNALCYLAAIHGDYETAKQLFIALGDKADVGGFHGQENYLALRKKCGADDIMAGSPETAERAGKLDDAEQMLVVAASDPALHYFYQRQGMEKKLRAMNLFENGVAMNDLLDSDPAKASRDMLSGLVLICPTLGKWDKAKAAAQISDEQFPWSLEGKSVLLLCAAHSGDTALAEATKKAILALQTNRPCYKTAQSVLSGEKTWEQVRDSMKTPDQYLAQGAMTIAFYYLTQGKPDLAHTVLEDTLPACGDDGNEKALMQSALYGSISRSLKEAAPPK